LGHESIFKRIVKFFLGLSIVVISKIELNRLWFTNDSDYNRSKIERTVDSIEISAIILPSISEFPHFEYSFVSLLQST
jgi:hypothetical protein